MIAAATGFTVLRMKGGETGPAFGAARLSPAWRRPANRPRPSARRLKIFLDATEPDPALAEAFAGQRRRFTALYAALKAEFRR